MQGNAPSQGFRHWTSVSAAAADLPVVDDDALELGEEGTQAAPLAQGRPVHVSRLRPLITVGMSSVSGRPQVSPDNRLT